MPVHGLRVDSPVTPSVGGFWALRVPQSPSILRDKLHRDKLGVHSGGEPDQSSPIIARNERRIAKPGREPHIRALQPATE